MSLIRYSASNPRALQDEIKQVFDKFLNHDDTDASSVVTSQWVPRVDIKEEGDRFLIFADLPGVDPNAIEVQMDKGILSIKGERRTESAAEGDRYSRIERAHGVLRHPHRSLAADPGARVAQQRVGVHAVPEHRHGLAIDRTDQQTGRDGLVARVVDRTVAGKRGARPYPQEPQVVGSRVPDPARVSAAPQHPTADGAMIRVSVVRHRVRELVFTMRRGEDAARTDERAAAVEAAARVEQRDDGVVVARRAGEDGLRDRARFVLRHARRPQENRGKHPPDIGSRHSNEAYASRGTASPEST